MSTTIKKDFCGSKQKFFGEKGKIVKILHGNNGNRGKCIIAFGGLTLLGIPMLFAYMQSMLMQSVLMSFVLLQFTLMQFVHINYADRILIQSKLSIAHFYYVSTSLRSRGRIRVFKSRPRPGTDLATKPTDSRTYRKRDGQRNRQKDRWTA